jgi:hypothetical protein
LRNTNPGVLKTALGILAILLFSPAFNQPVNAKNPELASKQLKIAVQNSNYQHL